jgi:hypothetical protein
VNSWPAGITCNPDGGICKKIMWTPVFGHKFTIWLCKKIMWTPVFGHKFTIFFLTIGTEYRIRILLFSSVAFKISTTTKSFFAYYLL